MKDLDQVLAAALTRPAAANDARVPPEAGAHAIARVAEAIRANARRRRVRRVVTGLIAAAAMVAGLLVTLALLRVPPEGLEVESAHLALVSRNGASVAVTPGARLEVGARVETTSRGSVRMRFKTGSQVWLDQQSALELLSTGVDQNLRLSEGRVHAEVAPLTAGQRFRIVTPDTELEVRGTRFVVEWLGRAACPGQAATRVRVEEGTVWVRHEQEQAEIHAGQAWPAECAAAIPEPEPEAVAAPVAPRPSTSRLAEENRRFAEVLQARQAGRPDRALELLDALRRDFPRGQLQEDVCAEEMRLAEERDPARARRAAKTYLKQFPRGYARALAEELIAPQP